MQPPPDVCGQRAREKGVELRERLPGGRPPAAVVARSGEQAGEEALAAEPQDKLQEEVKEKSEPS